MARNSLSGLLRMSLVVMHCSHPPTPTPRVHFASVFAWCVPRPSPFLPLFQFCVLYWTQTKEQKLGEVFYSSVWLFVRAPFRLLFLPHHPTFFIPSTSSTSSHPHTSTISPFHLQPSHNHRRGSCWPPAMVSLLTTRTLCKQWVNEDQCWCRISCTWMKWPTLIGSASQRELSMPKEPVSIRFIVYQFVEPLNPLAWGYWSCVLVSLHIWQSRVEIEGYSVAYFDRIVAFEAPYCWTSIKGGTHMRFVDSWDIHTSTKRNDVSPLTEAQRYGTSKPTMRLKYVME